MADDTTPKRRPSRRRTTPKPAATEPPPVGAQEEAPTPPPKRRRAGGGKALHTAVQENYVLMGMLLYGAGAARSSASMQQVGMGFVSQSESLADQWMKVADQHPAIRVALERMTTVSAVGALVGTHIAILSPVAEQLVPEGLRPAFVQMGMMVNTPTPPTDN